MEVTTPDTRAAEPRDDCTCGEFAGTSVFYADCPVHNPEQPHAETLETVEWGYQATTEGGVRPVVTMPSDASAESRVADLTRRLSERGYYNGRRFVSAAVVRRTRVSTPDVVGPWEVVS